MSQANQADFFGEGTNSGVQAPYDPNDEPNPNNPGGISNNEYMRQQRAYRANPANRQGTPQPINDAARAAQRANLRRPDNNTVLDALSQLGRNPIVNPLGYAATKAGNAVNNAVGADVSGYIQDPVGQGLKDLGAPDAVQALSGPGYIVRQGVNSGTGYGTNPGQILQNASSAANNLRNDGRNVATAVRNAPSAVSNAFNGVGGMGGSGASGAPIGGTPQYQQTGGGALSAEAQRILGQAGQMAQQSQAQANTFYGQAAQAGTRAAPQMAMPSSAQQDAVYDRAMNFNAQSGAAAIRAERADISGAGRLESMQLDQQGINNLEGFRSENSQLGVDALNAFNTRATLKAAADLAAFQGANTAEGAEAVRNFYPQQVQQDAESLRNFRADRTGIDRLNAYADEAEGPSAAQAMLRGQADADKRTQLAIARSGRGVAGSVQAQRQAMTEGAMIEAETRGQAATLRAQETDAYKNRQLQALAQAGSLISQSEAQRLTALSNAGSLMSQADQQKLAALTAYGQLKATQDSQILAGKQSAGQLTAQSDNMRLGATQSAASLQGQMDAQRLGAVSNAAQLRTQGDSIRSNNLQAAGNIRLQGSEINQRGAIAASNADLQAQALNLQSLSLAGNVSTAIRSQNIDVLKSNLSADLQTMGLNDQQVRFFSQMASDREVASQNLQMQANSMGANLEQAQQALDLQWAQFGFNQLTTQQQAQYQQQVFNATNARANRQEIAGYAGAGLTALSSLFGSGGGAAPGGGGGGGYAPPLPQVPSFQLSMPQIGYQNVGSGGGANAAGAPAGLGQLPNSGQLTMPTYQTPYAQQYGQPSEVNY